MKAYHFTEAPYPVDEETFEAIDSLRVTLPNQLIDPRVAADLWHNYLDQWQYADELGMDVMVNEHHATATCMNATAPLIAAIVGKPDFSAVHFTIRGTPFPVGDFINAMVSFLLIASTIYFFVVLPVNTLVARMNRGEKPPDPSTKKCPECLSEIPIEARRCAHCTQPVMGRAA